MNFLAILTSLAGLLKLVPPKVWEKFWEIVIIALADAIAVMIHARANAKKRPADPQGAAA